jgi:hypothetical protein
VRPTSFMVLEVDVLASTVSYGLLEACKSNTSSIPQGHPHLVGDRARQALLLKSQSSCNIRGSDENEQRRDKSAKFNDHTRHC